MQITTSYGVRIKANKTVLSNTVLIYRQALSYVIDIVDLEWDSLSAVDSKYSNARTMHIEKLIHSTKRNTAKYSDFDKNFYKFPSYLRRSVIATAIGAVSSYRSNLINWESGNKIGRPPALQADHHSFPTFYKVNMYKKTGRYSALIKVYKKKDWVWLEVPMRKGDIDYLIRKKSDAKELAPTLEKRHKNWELRFTYQEHRKLTNSDNVIVAVDLGVNTDATVVAMDSSGTILGRKFIAFPKEKDRMHTLLNQIKRNQQRGNYRNPKLWSLVNNKNRGLTEKIACAIIDFAILWSADVIVFERINLTGKMKGSRKQRLHLWKKCGVQEIVITKAHLQGLRIRRVNPWGTSRFAFDGSGAVYRGQQLSSGRKNYQICMFSTGKEYNCNLNASYNIGARYYIRERLKSLPEMVRLEAEAKVPRLFKRTTCVLADLISLNVVLRDLNVA